MDQAVLDAVVGTYYPDVARAGSAARARSQAAQSVATLFATGLTASLSFTSLQNQPLGLRIAGCVAAACWATATVLYMLAVGGPAVIDDRLRSTNRPDQLVRIVLDRAKAERQTIDDRQTRANVAAALALLLTVATFAGAALLPASENVEEGILAPTGDQRNLIEAACGPQPPTVRGIVMTSSRTAGKMQFTVSCGTRKARLTIPDSNAEQVVIIDR